YAVVSADRLVPVLRGMANGPAEFLPPETPPLLLLDSKTLERLPPDDGAALRFVVVPQRVSRFWQRPGGFASADGEGDLAVFTDATAEGLVPVGIPVRVT